MVPRRVSLAALLVAVCFASTIKAGWAPESLNLTSNKGLEKFSLELFTKLSEKYTPTGVDFVVSPISIWSRLLLVTEGATGSSRKQLQTVLGVPNDEQTLRQDYQIIHNKLNISTSSVEIKTLQALFPRNSMPIYCEFKDIVEKYYGADIIPVDYTKPKEAAATINDKVRRATNNFITDVLDPEDLKCTELVMLTTLYFKGHWKFSFEKSLSQEEQFFDEYRKNITTVTLMRKTSTFPFLLDSNLQSLVVELPYGNDNRFSMVVLLPLRVSVSQVVKNLKTIGIANVLLKMDQNYRQIGVKKFELYLPKFTVSFGFTANEILQNMGVKDVFIPGNLKNIQPLMSISNLQQNAKVIVNEEGTTPDADLAFVNMSSRSKVFFNRPFAFMIVDRETKSMLLCGQVMKPSYSP